MRDIDAHMKPNKVSASKKTSKKSAPIILPSAEKISTLSELIIQHCNKEEKDKKYASVKHVLGLLGAGAILTTAFLMPSALIVMKPFIDKQNEKERNEWKQFNKSYLERTIKRLQKEKVVRIESIGDTEQIILTKNGVKKILQYSLESLEIDTPNTWDNKWRIVMYDVPHNNKHTRDIFRSTLKLLGFLQMQKSVWLYPYPCEKHISFLREFYGVGSEVVYIIATSIENEEAHKQYFGLS